ncbi:hypothetical protein ADH75_02975 [Flavonifractor plautii]|uniref:Uncharacterized protein n=1 Tax=Flavonifractor plautii TaxID=292800 RepID=A0AAX1KGE9_FLAPL|nr:hypothetical protein [Flavonifractor plautii]WAK79812.1 head protein [Flavonifractor phage Chenonceau]DAL91054.1 MAG TPA: YqbG [Caudoviricetes sp.]ANU42190.1 hypothetical protein A4U99_14445 [Flavonifractor plautii]OXE48554.1 hypothetical protein ADH75_02975 [Flavonifractor plautii]QQR04925.1 hypothetical protein I5Q84_13175 [Flavonifractor plautii]
MLEEVLQHLNNWFLVPEGIHAGEFTVQDGSITLPFLQTGQYFRVMGSVFNDGLHQYPAQDMTDETFDGVLWALAVPKAVISLADEIAVWDEKNGAQGPYTSESFGGYSYSKATNASGVAVGWQDVFKIRLNAWRRIGGII